VTRRRFLRLAGGFGRRRSDGCRWPPRGAPWRPPRPSPTRPGDGADRRQRGQHRRLSELSAGVQRTEAGCARQAARAMTPASTGSRPTPVKAMPGDPPRHRPARSTSCRSRCSRRRLRWPRTRPGKPSTKALNANVEFGRRDPGRLPRQNWGRSWPAATSPTRCTSTHLPARPVPSPPPTGYRSFLQSQAADLTPYLAGDAAKDYPNLAAIPHPGLEKTLAVRTRDTCT